MRQLKILTLTANNEAFMRYSKANMIISDGRLENEGVTKDAVAFAVIA